MWDVATGVNHSTLNHSKAVHCVASAPAGGATVAFGGAEADLRLWDPRSQNDDLVSHAPTPSALGALACKEVRTLCTSNIRQCCQP